MNKEDSRNMRSTFVIQTLAQLVDNKLVYVLQLHERCTILSKIIIAALTKGVT